MAFNAYHSGALFIFILFSSRDISKFFYSVNSATLTCSRHNWKRIEPRPRQRENPSTVSPTLRSSSYMVCAMKACLWAVECSETFQQMFQQLSISTKIEYQTTPPVAEALATSSGDIVQPST